MDIPQKMNKGGNSDTTDDPYWFLPDNASYHMSNNNCVVAWSGRIDQCGGPRCCCPNSTSDEHHLCLWKILRWIKLIAIKVGRSYYALPVALVIATLVAGLLFGFVFGRRYEQRIGRQQRKHRAAGGPSALSVAWWFGRLLDFQYLNTLLGRGASLTKYSAAKHDHHPPACLAPLKSKRCTPGRTKPSPLTMGPLSNASLGDVNELEQREATARVELKSDTETERQSGLSDVELPRHIAVVMDGNRRYGERKHGNAMQGHWEGSRKLLQFAKWCLAENIPELTVYAFSTENWQRDAHEVASLMDIIVRHVKELRLEAVQKKICIRIQSTNPTAIPTHIRVALRQLEEETQDGTALLMNICLSYGSRGEIVRACRTLAEDYRVGRLTSSLQIDEIAISNEMLVSEPDILIRTSGEVRISNFLLWQIAYAELFFLDKTWPELEKQDLLDVLRSYAHGRQRRFGT